MATGEYSMCFLMFVWNRIGGVKVSVLASRGADRGLLACYFSAKHGVLRRSMKDWLALNQDNVSMWCDMSTRGLLFQ